MNRPYDGSAQNYDVVTEHDVMIPMRDGTRMATNLYFPALDGRVAPGSFPVILERTPYGKNRHLHYLTGLFFARFGYVCAFQDTRGRFESEGEFFTMTKPRAHFYDFKDDSQDGYDTIEWLGSQSWSSGKVGTIGTSFNGKTQQTVAISKPPSLASQFIGDCGINYWRDAFRINGASTFTRRLPWIFKLAMNGREAQADPQLRLRLAKVLGELDKYLDRIPLKKGQTPLAGAPSYEACYLGMVQESDYTEFWRDSIASVEEYLNEWKDIPVCLFGGWHSYHVRANFEKYTHLREKLTSPVKLIMGPWVHSADMLSESKAGDVDFGPAALGEVNTIRLRWFDATLKGLNTGILDGPGIRYFIMGGGDGHKTDEGHLYHGGCWHTIDMWPPKTSTSTPFYLHPDGLLSQETPRTADCSTSYTYNPKDPVPTVGGKWGAGAAGAEPGPFDQRGQPEKFRTCRDTMPLSTRLDIVVFETPPLEEDVELTGEIDLVLWVSTSALDTDFTAKLVHVYPPSEDYPDGYAMNVQDTIVRLRYRNGRTRAELVEPGEIYKIELSLYSTSNLFQRGHRIRLDISSSNFPMFDANPNTGKLLGKQGPISVAHNTIYHDKDHPSHVLLPIMNR